MQKGWRLGIGVVLLIYNGAAYVLAALVPLLGLDGARAASLAGGLILSGELAFLAGVALLGKPFLETLKAKFGEWFARPPRPAAAAPISRARHAAGVSLFLFSFAPYLLSEGLLILGRAEPPGHAWILALLLASDALFVASFFVLGSEFWARVEACFAWPGAGRESAR
jgi:hypothetical protein